MCGGGRGLAARKICAGERVRTRSEKIEGENDEGFLWVRSLDRERRGRGRGRERGEALGEGEDRQGRVFGGGYRSTGPRLMGKSEDYSIFQDFGLPGCFPIDWEIGGLGMGSRRTPILALAHSIADSA